MNENDAVAGRDIKRENIFIVDHLEKKGSCFFSQQLYFLWHPISFIIGSLDQYAHSDISLLIVKNTS